MCFLDSIFEKKTNQKLVKQITDKGHIQQRFDSTRKIFTEFMNRKAEKEIQLNEIMKSIGQFEVIEISKRKIKP